MSRLARKFADDLVERERERNWQMTDRDLQRALDIARQRADRLELGRVVYEDQIADLKQQLAEAHTRIDKADGERDMSYPVTDIVALGKKIIDADPWFGSVADSALCEDVAATLAELYTRIDKATAKLLMLGDENARLREALNHIKDMQTFGYIVLGEEATGKMREALKGEPKDLGPMHPGLPSETQGGTIQP